MRSILRSSSLAALLVSAFLSAQSTNSIHYPQSGVDGSSGQIIPFGVLNGGNFDEGRWQQIIPARFLPSPGGLISGMEVLSQATLNMTYPRLAITMSLVPPGGGLSTTFANNLPSPVPVYAHQAVTLSWATHQWTTIPFDIPFFYDGTSDIVVDIQKAFDSITTPPSTLGHHQTDGDPGRSDLPIARDAFGQFGSGASSAATATSASGVSLKLGFQFIDLPTFNLYPPRGGASSHIFPIGGSFDATLNGFPGSVFGCLISFGWATSPLTIPGIGGSLVLDLGSLTAYASGSIGSGGSVTNTFGIPSSSVLVGVHVMFQGLSQTGSGALVMTNGIDGIINS